MSKKKKLASDSNKNTPKFQQKSLNDTVTSKLSPADLVNISSEKIIVSKDGASRIQQAEQLVLRVKLQLSDLEMSIADLNLKKQELVNLVRHENNKMMDIVREVAENHGIDPDGRQDDKKWNLNTNEMIFYRVQ